MRNVTWRAGVSVLLALVFLAGVALADEQVEKSGSAGSKGLVIIENMVGSIKVIGWDKDEIHLEGTLGEDVEELKFDTGSKKSRRALVRNALRPGSASRTVKTTVLSFLILRPPIDRYDPDSQPAVIDGVQSRCD